MSLAYEVKGKTARMNTQRLRMYCEALALETISQQAEIRSLKARITRLHEIAAERNKQTQERQES